VLFNTGRRTQVHDVTAEAMGLQRPCTSSLIPICFGPSAKTLSAFALQSAQYRLGDSAA